MVNCVKITKYGFEIYKSFGNLKKCFNKDSNCGHNDCKFN